MLSTIDTFPRLIKNIDEIPSTFKDYISSFVSNNTGFPYMIFIPQNWWGFKFVPAKLIVLLEDRILVAEKNKKKLLILNYLFNDIYYIQKGIVLLHSWIKLIGLVNGNISISFIEFNSVGAKIFRPVVEKFRMVSCGLEINEKEKEKLKKEKEKFLYLLNSNYKYMNFGSDSIMPGENVQNMLLQPGIKVKYCFFFKRYLNVQHFSILTDKELIIIHDNDTLRSLNIIEFGGIWNFIPLNKIKNISLESYKDKKEIISLNIKFSDEINLKLFYSDYQKENVDVLINNIQKKNQNLVN